MIELSNSDGHIVLACKGWYDVKGINMTESLGRLQAAFCGWSGKEHGPPLEAVADKLYRILRECKSDDYMEHLMFRMHRWMINGWWVYSEEGKELSCIEKMIIFYRSEVADLQVRKGDEILIKLPKPKKRAAKVIIRGIQPFTLDLVRKLEAA